MSTEKTRPKCENCGGETKAVDGPFTISVMNKRHTIYGHGYACKKCEHFFPSERLNSHVADAEDW